MQETHLSHKHAHTLQQIFQHPASHNLEWRNVVALIRDNGTVQEETNGHLIFTLNGISEVFSPSQDKKDVSDVEQVLDIRRFMERAGFKQDGTIALPEWTTAEEGLTERETQHDQSRLNEEQNRHAEQQIKTQQREQNDRSAFQEGNAQAHQQGNRQK